ncbi:UNVERIFIED_CONTAM: hypothetical protein NCL1_28832 [Trichonephila clavipes]
MAVAAVTEWSMYRIVVGLVTSSSPVPLKTNRVGQRCTLNHSRAQTSSRWCGVVVRRGGQIRCRTRRLTMIQNYVVRCQKHLCSSTQCDVNIHSLIHAPSDFFFRSQLKLILPSHLFE